MTTLNIGVILAAGRGERSGYENPKQMMKLAGKPIVEHAIAAFQDSELIDQIFVVTNGLCKDRIEDIVANQRFRKVSKVILGGSERYESSLAAIDASASLARTHAVRLVFHDAVRPLVSQGIIRSVVQALEHYGAVDVAVPAVDTVVAACPMTNTIRSIPERSTLRYGQTPQGFAWDVIDRAYRLALRDPNFRTTDDCGVVLRYLPDERIYLVDGDTGNMKLTYRDDLHVIDKLLQMRTKRLITGSLDDRRLAGFRGKVVAILGGTSGIGEKMAATATAYQAKVETCSRRTGVDVAEIESVRSWLDEIARRHGRIDHIVNTAGILRRRPLALMEYPEILESVRVNYLGLFNVALAGFEHLKASHGHLLNFTSSSYTYGRAWYSLYSSSKAAVVNATQALAEEWHDDHVRVSCVNPGRTDTPMRREAFGREDPKDLLDAQDVAKLALSVLLDPSTGQVYDIAR
jgi:2-C-methyl-D-erythritol 4-phosphate cytidylyltransferase